MFFVISGFLITESYELTTFVLGLFVSDLSFERYLRSPSIYEYVGSNLLLLGKSDRLPGVFDGNVLPWVNGSRWTLHKSL